MIAAGYSRTDARSWQWRRCAPRAPLTSSRPPVIPSFSHSIIPSFPHSLRPSLPHLLTLSFPQFHPAVSRDQVQMTSLDRRASQVRGPLIHPSGDVVGGGPRGR